MRAAICDDERYNAEKVGYAVEDFFSKKEMPTELSYFGKGSALLQSVKDGAVYDAIFMDKHYRGAAEHRLRRSRDICNEL